MQLRTNLNRWDLFLFRVFVTFKPGFNLYLLLGCAIAVPAFLSPELLAGPPLSNFVFVLLVLVVFFLMSVVGLFFSFLEIMFASAYRRGLLGGHVLTLTSEGLVEETEFNRTVHPWSSVEPPRSLFGMTFVRVGAGWQVIPKRDAETSQGGSSFIAELRERTRVAK